MHDADTLLSRDTHYTLHNAQSHQDRGSFTNPLAFK